MIATASPILNRMLRPLAQGLGDELLSALSGLETEPAEEQRYHSLADRNTEGTLTPEEHKELADIVSTNTFLSILRGQARQTLASRHS
jgi:hypothetical protein